MRMYRGMTKDGKEVKGWYLEAEKKHFIVPFDGECTVLEFTERTCISIHDVYVVIPSTVGQSTGLKDKNGVEIFEGDIVQSENGHKYTIKWQQEFARYYMEYETGHAGFGIIDVDLQNCEVIGNIHQKGGE